MSGRGMTGTGFSTISSVSNLDPVAERLCFCGIYTQNFTKGWKEATDVIVFDVLCILFWDADESKETSESAHELNIDIGLGSQLEKGDRVSESKSGTNEHKSGFLM